MRVRKIGLNQLQIDKRNGSFLISYETPVAALIPGIGWVRTDKFWSKTTSKHINQWLEGNDAECIPQEQLDAYLDQGT